MYGMSMPALPGNQPRLVELDGLRGVAVLMVLVLHLYVRVPATGTDADTFFHHLFSLLYCGVDLFFVLSGFFIGGILIDHRRSPNLLPVFYRRRFLRILPVYGLLVLSYYVGRAQPGLATVNFSTYFTSLVPPWTYWVFLQNIAMAHAGDLGSYWLAPSWSLAVEQQFYLLLPFVTLLLERRALLGCCLAAILLTPVLRILVWENSGNMIAAIFLAPMRADALMAGVLCAVVLRDETAVAGLRAHLRWLAGLTGLLGFVLIKLSLDDTSAIAPVMVAAGYTVAALFFAGCLILCVLRRELLPVRLLTWPPLVRLGLVSYFVYLAHLPVWYTAHWLIRGRAPSHLTLTGAAVTILAVVVVYFLAEFSWRFLEGPLLALGRRKAYRTA